MNDPNPANPKPRWCQFSLRTLCLFAMVVSVGASYLGVKLKQEQERRKVIAEIEKLGGEVYGAVTPKRRSFGGLVGGVDLGWSERLTDADLEHVKTFTHLKELNLNNTGVTDAGLEHLTGLKLLDTLRLNDTGVTDAGLEHLKGVRQLELLNLNSTGVTDAGVENLQQALPNCMIYR